MKLLWYFGELMLEKKYTIINYVLVMMFSYVSREKSLIIRFVRKINESNLNKEPEFGDGT